MCHQIWVVSDASTKFIWRNKYSIDLYLPVGLTSPLNFLLLLLLLLKLSPRRVYPRNKKAIRQRSPDILDCDLIDMSRRRYWLMGTCGHTQIHFWKGNQRQPLRGTIYPLPVKKHSSSPQILSFCHSSSTLISIIHASPTVPGSIYTNLATSTTKPCRTELEQTSRRRLCLL